ncbi:MAG: hypothetical protein AAGC43_14455 [Bacteroidota bacterium]
MEKSKVRRIATITGCILLIVMALFHSSGIYYITELVQKSNTEPFLKEILPVLFLHPSIQLFGLAMLGILTLFMKYEFQKILGFIVILVLIDSFLAFYLGAILPGVLLALSAFVLGLGAVKSK